ncbi:MAG: toprim domain-containing protein [Nanoarchaeota archaeon]
MAISTQEMDEWVRDINSSEIPIIVEGRKDKTALRNIGINNDILLYYSQPRYRLIEHIAKHHKKVIILTDNDKEGRKLYGVLNGELSRFGVTVDKIFREFLQRETKLDQIEGIETYCRHLSEDPPI